jgi:hypothetical protein
MSVANELQKVIKMNEDEQKEAKTNFDLVCDYHKRRVDFIKSEELYTKPLVKFLVNKTFKKSVGDSYTLVSSFRLTDYFKDTSKTLKINCIGGGPGSDLTGVLCYLMELGFFDFDCTIHDYNAKNYSEICLEPLQETWKSQAKKFFGKAPEIQL